tara:strand:- start:211 stop:1248 length:1038 start_codon:yes stop_codon:yes gene_type:complete
MKTIFLIHTSNSLLHYRISIYNYFYDYFKIRGFELHVFSNDIQKDNPYEIKFKHHLNDRGKLNLLSTYISISPNIVITFCSLKDIYVIPIFIIHKILNKKIIYWGHGVKLNNPKSWRWLFNLWHYYSDAILLYSKNEMKYIKKHLHSKTFIANNTLNYSDLIIPSNKKKLVDYGITTTFNVVFVGRIEKRKKIEDLLIAAKYLNKEIGVVIIGNDLTNILPDVLINNVFYLGPKYNVELHSILSQMDLFCLPGHVGLSIVDAFYHGLPIITQNVDHAPEIIYLKNKLNGFILRDKYEIPYCINKLSKNKLLMNKMSNLAKQTFDSECSIDLMLNSFMQSIYFVNE